MKKVNDLNNQLKQNIINHLKQSKINKFSKQLVLGLSCLGVLSVVSCDNEKTKTEAKPTLQKVNFSASNASSEGITLSDYLTVKLFITKDEAGKAPAHYYVGTTEKTFEAGGTEFKIEGDSLSIHLESGTGDGKTYYVRQFDLDAKGKTSYRLNDFVSFNLKDTDDTKSVSLALVENKTKVEGETKADRYAAIEDPNFLNYLKTILPANAFNKEGKLDTNSNEVKTLKRIDVRQVLETQKRVKSLEGIQYFIGLTHLECSYNELESLDLSKNTMLDTLRCHKNKLKNLNVSQNTRLKRLLCYDNQLENLDVSKNTVLEELFCNTNQLKSLNVSQNHALKLLYFYGNQVITLDVRQNLKLEQLYFSRNKITSLDVRKNTALKELECAENKVSTLDLSQNTELEILRAGDCGLSNLNIDYNTKLKQLFCSENQLTKLDVSQNTALERLWTHGNPLKKLDVSQNTALEALACWGNQLDSLDVSNNTHLTELYCYDNNLKILDVSKNTALKYLKCYGNKLTSLDLSHNCNLIKRWVMYDQGVIVTWCED